MYKVQFPDNNFLNDYAGVLKPADVSNIKANLEKFNHQTGTELSVVTVKNVAQSRATNIDALALDFFSSWGIGRTVSNKGILVLISKEDHRAFIELGEGFPRELKAELNASVANFADPIKSERFAEGINQGISSLIGTIMRPVPLNERKWFKALVFGIGVAFVISVIVSCIVTGEGGWGFFVVSALVNGLMFALAVLASGRHRRHSWDSFMGHNRYGGSSGSW